VQFVALGVIDVAIDAGDVHQQRRSGQTNIVLGELVSVIAFTELANELPESLEHRHEFPVMRP
jgi:hypothetical protein